MTDTQLAVSGMPAIDPAFALMLAQGDYGRATESQKAMAIVERCRVLGLDPRAAPFQFITAGGKTFMYANAGCSASLAIKHSVGVRVTKTERIDDLFIVSSRASTPDGRETDDIGAVSIIGLKGDALANAMMKAHTKSARRAILKHCGLSMPDETELDTIPGVRMVRNEAPQSATPADMIGEADAQRLQDRAERAGITRQQFEDWAATTPDIAKHVLNTESGDLAPLPQWPRSLGGLVQSWIKSREAEQDKKALPVAAAPAGKSDATTPEYWWARLLDAIKECGHDQQREIEFIAMKMDDAPQYLSIENDAERWKRIVADIRAKKIDTKAFVGAGETPRVAAGSVPASYSTITDEDLNFP